MSEQPFPRLDATLSDSRLVPSVPLAPLSLLTIPGAAPLPEQSAAAPTQWLGRFEVHGQIGQGGMGAVLRGRDPILGRDLALKVLLADKQDDADARRRFHEEAQIGGQLQHPGLVPVYELGNDGDLPFFAMKLIEGRTLTELLKARVTPGANTPGWPSDLPRFLTIFEQVCQAVGYAHARGVIHRDLKPSNIMVGAFGEVQVMDWGLAKVIGRIKSPEAASTEKSVRTAPKDADGSGSRAGTVLGTPSYMPPEQARGEIDSLDRRSDVFGLGAILCELLMGKPPFLGRDGKEILRRAGRGDLAEAFGRLDGSGADAELVGLAKECLAVEPNDRPADAAAVAARVTAYQAGVAERLRTAELERAAAEVRAVEERKRAIVERQKRRRTLALAGAVFLLVIGAGGSAWWWQQQRAQTVARQREAEQRIQLALDDARNRLNETRRTGKMELFPEAKASLDKAREVARTLQIGDRIQAKIDVLDQRWQTDFAAANKGQRLLTACLEVRQPREVGRYERGNSGRMTTLAEPSIDEHFALAFRSWDPEFDVGRPDEALKRLQALPEPMIQELVAALDEWWQARRDSTPPGDWRTLYDLTDGLDANGLRRELRTILASGELETERRAAEVTAAVWPLSGLLRLGRGGLDEVLGAAALTAPPVSRKVAQEVGRNRISLRTLAGRIDHRNESVLTLLALSRALSRSGDADSAEEVLNTAVTVRPGEAALWMAMGELLERRQPPRLDRAIECYRAARAVRPELGVALGNALSKIDRNDEGEAILRELLRGQPDNPELHSKLGNILLEKSDSFTAMAEYREAIRLKPDYPNAHVNLGNIFYYDGMLPEAIAEYREGIRLKHDFAMAYFNLGSAFSRQGKLPEEVAAYREAARLNPASSDNRFHLGLALRKQGNLPEAVAAFHEASRLNPDLHYVHFNLGEALKAQGHLPEAVGAYREAIRLWPDGPAAHYNLGGTFAEQGKLPDAVAAYREAIRLKPDYYEAHYNLGRALGNQGKLPEEVAAYREAIRLHPDYYEAHFYLGNSLAQQGKLPEAVGAYREAIRLWPDDPWAHSSLGDTLMAQGKLPEALEEFRESTRLDPNNARLHCTLGVVLRQRGLRNEAIQEFRVAVQLDGAHVGDAIFNLADALREKGDLDEAGSVYCKILSLEHKDDQAIALAARLPALLSEEARPANAEEALFLARICKHTKRYGASGRFYADAFTAKPSLADDLANWHHYNAACYAALAAAGQAQDAKNLPDKVVVGLRRQTLLYLRADLALYAKLADSDQAAAKETVPQRLAHWQQDTDLATVRDAIDQLPETERAAWRQLWEDVSALLKRAEAPK